MRFAFPLPWMLAAGLCLPAAIPAQSMRVADLAVGKLLVAPRDSPDPNFAKTVVLLVEIGQEGTVGLILNRRTSVPVSRVFERVKGAGSRTDPVYVGGPVDLESVLALLKSSTPPGDARQVLRSVYLVATRALLEKTMASAVGPGEFHAYLGYCGWDKGQLEAEVKLKGWYIFDGDPAMVFDSDPASLWSRLIARTEQNFAQGRWPLMADVRP